jgi:hypothetical protein
MDGKASENTDADADADADAERGASNELPAGVGVNFKLI